MEDSENEPERRRRRTTRSSVSSSARRRLGTAQSQSKAPFQAQLTAAEERRMDPAWRSAVPRFQPPQLTPAHNVDYSHAHRQDWLSHVDRPSATFLAIPRQDGPREQGSHKWQAPPGPGRYDPPKSAPAPGVFVSRLSRFPSESFPDRTLPLAKQMGVPEAFPMADARAREFPATMSSSLNQNPSYRNLFQRTARARSGPATACGPAVGPATYSPQPSATWGASYHGGAPASFSVSTLRGAHRFPEDAPAVPTPVRVAALAVPKEPEPKVPPSDVWAPTHQSLLTSAHSLGTFSKLPRFEYAEIVRPSKHAVHASPTGGGHTHELDSTSKLDPRTPSRRIGGQTSGSATRGGVKESSHGGHQPRQVQRENDTATRRPGFGSSGRFSSPAALAVGDTRNPRAQYGSDSPYLGPGHTIRYYRDDADDDEAAKARAKATRPTSCSAATRRDGSARSGRAGSPERQSAVFRSRGRDGIALHGHRARKRPVEPYALEILASSAQARRVPGAPQGSRVESICPATDTYFRLRRKAEKAAEARREFEMRRKRHQARSDPIKSS